MYRRKLVHGVGINDADYEVCRWVNGELIRCPFYMKWDNMLKRCYYKISQKRNSSYQGCHVDPSWHSFMAFRSWMERQDWQGKDLDKDLLGNGKWYSPETCVFVPRALNSFTTDRAAKRGKWPIGVCFDRESQKFIANIGVNGKNKNLGRFKTALEAHLAWVQAKSALALDWIERMTDRRVKDALHRFIVKIIENSMSVQ